jgi:hypothetical protein
LTETVLSRNFEIAEWFQQMAGAAQICSYTTLLFLSAFLTSGLTLLSNPALPRKPHLGGEHVHGMSVMPAIRRLCLQSFELFARSVEDRQSAWERVGEAPCGVERLLTSRVVQEQQADDGWTLVRQTAIRRCRSPASYPFRIRPLVSSRKKSWIPATSEIAFYLWAWGAPLLLTL